MIQRARMMLDALDPAQRRFIAWTLATALGWGLGLTLAGVALSVSFLWPPLRVILALLLLGFPLGTLQWIAGLEFPIERRWLTLTMIGTSVGLCVASGTSLLAGAISQNLTWILMCGGVFFGASVGAAQSVALDGDQAVVSWILANALGGGACALLVFSGFSSGVLHLCSIGPVIFGLIVAGAIHLIVRMDLG